MLSGDEKQKQKLESCTDEKKCSMLGVVVARVLHNTRHAGSTIGWSGIVEFYSS